MIAHDDYKTIRRSVGLSPAEWNRLQREDEYRRYVRPFYVDVEARIYSCRCRSVWCKTCAVSSPTNATITQALLKLDWRKIRHVILTIDRAYDADEGYEDVRRTKAIPRLVRRLTGGSGRYLWALEWHADGYPHWHLLVEGSSSGAAGRIGKQKIQGAWGRGICWETFIRDDDHWKAICGYHKSRGYLAGERKAHQLELPEWLRGQSRVRKFGTNVPRGTSPGLRGTPHGDAPRRKRAPAKAYKDRDCDRSCVVVARGGSVQLPVPGRVAREAFGVEMDMIDCTTYRGNVDSFWRAMARLPTGNPAHPAPDGRDTGEFC